MEIDKDDIRRYREGSLSEAERHALEKKALNDPFLADALEGSENINADEFSIDMKSLRDNIQRRHLKTAITPLRIAAGIAILIGTASLFYYLSLPEPDSLALDHSAPSGEAAQSGPAMDSARLTEEQPTETEEIPKAPVVVSEPKALALSDQQASSQAKTLREDVSEEKNTEKKPAPDSREGEKSVTEEIASERKVAASEQVPSFTRSQIGAGASKKESVNLQAVDKDDARLESKIISGKVSSFEDGSPIPGANVLIKGSRQGTVTDANGNFSISMNDSDQPLQVSFIGMHTKEIIPHAQSVLHIQLSEDATQLSEVVVSGNVLQPNPASDEPILKLATPVGGLKAYNKYLENNLRYPPQALPDRIKGKVIIQFTIATDGKLSNFNVLKSLGHGCDEEVIRLVQEGPSWIPSTENDVSIESEAKVKMKFDPEKVKR